MAITCDSIITKRTSEFFTALVSDTEIEFDRKDAQDGTTGPSGIELSPAEWADFLELVAHINTLLIT